jgi:hypothetical protein
MTVQAKFRCVSVMQCEGGQENVTLWAANGPQGSENGTWSQYTPTGNLTMSITAKGAVGVFKPGVHYYLDIRAEEVPVAA